MDVEVTYELIRGDLNIIEQWKEVDISAIHELKVIRMDPGKYIEKRSKTQRGKQRYGDFKKSDWEKGEEGEREREG